MVFHVNLEPLSTIMLLFNFNIITKHMRHFLENELIKYSDLNTYEIYCSSCQHFIFMEKLTQFINLKSDCSKLQYKIIYFVYLKKQNVRENKFQFFWSSKFQEIRILKLPKRPNLNQNNHASFF